MHKATIVSRSQISGEHVHTVEHEDHTMFYAQIVGVVEGVTAAGSVVVSVTHERGH